MPQLLLSLAVAARISAAADSLVLPLPPRAHDTRGGKAIALAVAGLDLDARKAVLQKEILSGNVPEFLRFPVEVKITAGSDTLVMWTMPDYLAVGREGDAFLTPLSPGTARTPGMVDAIYRAAVLELAPVP